MNFLYDCILVFLLVFGADIIWARYISAIAVGKRFLAANYSMLIWCFGAVSFAEFISNYWLIIPACIGAWVGTYYGTKDEN